MASANKCDRCGVLYDTWFFDKRDKDKYLFKDNLIRIGGQGEFYCYDLCSECYKKLVKFMKMED